MFQVTVCDLVIIPVDPDIVPVDGDIFVAVTTILCHLKGQGVVATVSHCSPDPIVSNTNPASLSKIANVDIGSVRDTRQVQIKSDGTTDGIRLLKIQDEGKPLVGDFAFLPIGGVPTGENDSNSKAYGYGLDEARNPTVANQRYADVKFDGRHYETTTWKSPLGTQVTNCAGDSGGPVFSNGFLVGLIVAGVNPDCNLVDSWFSHFGQSLDVGSFRDELYQKANELVANCMPSSSAAAD